MNKLNIISVLLSLLLVSSAAAFVDVTYHFNVPNVEVSAYNVQNSVGSAVSAFSGSFPQGTATTNGTLTIRFPNSLATPYGYGIYYVSYGYLPLEGLATWNTGGNPAAFQQDYSLDFSKLSSCRAVIDQFTVTNNAQANVPVVVNMQTGLDASLLSAFHLTDNQLAYVPPQYKAEFYSADIQVSMTVYNSADQVVNTQTQAFTVFADEYVPVSFTWVPSTAGAYRAVVTTAVVDNQCNSSVPGTSQKDFTVQSQLPQNQCYAIMNGLYAVPEVPVVGENVTVHFTKISNHANNVPYGSPGYTLDPIPTQVSTKVQAPSGILQQSTSTLAANANNADPIEYTFTFTPTQAGLHTITVTGVGSSSLCNNLVNKPETLTLQTMVSEQKTYKVSFQLADAVNGAKVQGAVVNMAGQFLPTDANGIVSFSALQPGTYSYVITHPNYQTFSGTTTVTDSDQVIFLSMQQGNGTVTPLPTPSSSTTASAVDDEFGIKLSSVQIGHAFEQQAGGEAPVYLTFKNNGNARMHHVKATVVIQDLAIRASIGPFDLASGDKRSETVYVPLDDSVQPGTYPVRVTIQSDETTRVVYREIEVTE
jgi:hypothetical protein